MLGVLAWRWSRADHLRLVLKLGVPKAIPPFTRVFKRLHVMNCKESSGCYEAVYKVDAVLLRFRRPWASLPG
jgi:hypothetical protein